MIQVYFLSFIFIHSLYKSQESNMSVYMSKHTNDLVFCCNIPNRHTPQSVTISKKSKSQSSHSPFVLFFLSHQQMFLSRMVNIHMVNIKIILLLILYLAHPFNLIQVSFLSFISFIVSTNLKQQISSYLKK